LRSSAPIVSRSVPDSAKTYSYGPAAWRELAGVATGRKGGTDSFQVRAGHGDCLPSRWEALKCRRGINHLIYISQ
jgi:hypothetical protein